VSTNTGRLSRSSPIVGRPNCGGGWRAVAIAAAMAGIALICGYVLAVWS
jgi:hypothetical protein